MKTRTPDEALDEALALVNNVSKKRLLNNVGSVRLLLQEMEPDVQSEAESGNSFIKLLGKEAKESVQEVYNYSGCILVTVCRLLRIPEDRAVHDLCFRE